MAMPNTQPTLPAEGAYTDAELLFISEEPRNLFPPNQNSNWGLLRHILTGKPQEVNDLLTDLYNQVFYGTSTGALGYLGRWENQVGVPKAPTGYTDAQRRVWVGLNKKRRPFTKAHVREIVESLLVVGGGGPPIELGVGGHALSAGGSPLYSEGGAVTTQYRIYYNPRNFSYEVWIVNSSTPDLVALARKLTRITPAGQSYTIDNTKSAIIDYGRTIISKQPAAFYRLADFTDSSGSANNGTSSGTISALASPGLLTSGKNDDQAGKTFDGTTGYFTAPDQNYIDVGDRFTIEFWIKPTNLTGTQIIVDKGANGYQVRENAGTLELWKSGVGLICAATIPLVAATTYYCAVRKSGSTVKWTINTTDRTGTITQRTIEDTASLLYVGRLAASSTNFLAAGLDELAIYDRFLSDAELLENYNAGKNIL